MKLFGTKRRLKRLAIGLGILVALLLIANGVFAWWTEWQWQSRLAALRAAGEPASIADLAPQPIPDDQNAAVYIERIQPKLKGFSKAMVEFGETDVGKSYEQTRERGELPTPEQSEAMKAILEAHAEIPTAVDDAVAAGNYASRLDYSLGHEQFMEELIDKPHIIRTVARYYDWWMRTLVAEGDHEEAVHSGLQMLRLTRLYEAEPTIVSHLVAIACREISILGIDRALRAGPIADELRKAIDDELTRHDDPQLLLHALKTERAFSASSMDLHMAEINTFLAQMLGWPIKRYYIGVLDSFNLQLLPLAAKPWHEVSGKEIGDAGALQTPSGFGVLADLLQPAIQSAHVASNRSRAMVRALRISNALAAYREQHGREAEGLDDLPLAKEAVVDPFSGNPLKLKHTDQGWLIYTVYNNDVDDNGDFTKLNDYGLAPPGYEKRSP